MKVRPSSTSGSGDEFIGEVVGARDCVEVDEAVPCGIERNGASARLLRNDRDRYVPIVVGRLTRQPHRERFATAPTMHDVEIDDVTQGKRESLRASYPIDVDRADRQFVWQDFELANELPDGQHDGSLHGGDCWFGARSPRSGCADTFILPEGCFPVG